MLREKFDMENMDSKSESLSSLNSNDRSSTESKQPAIDEVSADIMTPMVTVSSLGVVKTVILNLASVMAYNGVGG